MATEGIPIILIRDQCSMDDLPGIEVAEGILTMRGGISNDVVDLVREMDKTAIIGGGYFGMKVDETEECVRNSENQICIQKRQMITLDGNSGRIHEGETPLIRTADKFNLMGIDEFLRVIQWANTYRNRDIALSINVVDPEKKTDSIKFHPRRAIYNTSDMFSNKPCHDLMQKYLLNESRGATNYLRLLEEFHRQDWMKIFKSSGGENFTIKLHDSSMNLYFELEEAEKNCQIYSSLEEYQSKWNALKEDHPYLGIRGCRNGIFRRDFVIMQIRAIQYASIFSKIIVDPLRIEILIPAILSPIEVLTMNVSF